MAKANQPLIIQERLSPFNCPSCGSMKEIAKTYANGKQVLECGDCHVDKEKHLQKQVVSLKQGTWKDSKPCPECGSKKRYSLVENGKDVDRCSNCDQKVQ